MFNRLKNRVLSVVTPDIPALPAASGSGAAFTNHQQQHLQNPHNYTRGGSSGSSSSSRHNANPHNLPDKFAYSRPGFLQLCTVDELRASADHNVRPIIVPRDVALMPWSTGYAECVNSGKSEWNEDQAAFQRQTLSLPAARRALSNGGGGGGGDVTHLCTELPYIYFGTFDGHAGYGAALAASHQFHHILHEKLVDVIEMLMPTVVVQDDDDEDSNEADGDGKKKRTTSVTLNSTQRMLPHPQTLFQK